MPLPAPSCLDPTSIQSLSNLPKALEASRADLLYDGADVLREAGSLGLGSLAAAGCALLGARYGEPRCLPRALAAARASRARFAIMSRSCSAKIAMTPTVSLSAWGLSARDNQHRVVSALDGEGSTARVTACLGGSKPPRGRWQRFRSARRRAHRAHRRRSVWGTSYEVAFGILTVTQARFAGTVGCRRSSDRYRSEAALAVGESFKSNPRAFVLGNRTMRSFSSSHSA